MMTFFKQLGQRYQSLLDRLTPHAAARWIFTVLLIVGIWVRILVAQGWYTVTYALAIFHTLLLLSFLTPATKYGEDEDGPELPTHVRDEFRPFIRRLPEFKFWILATYWTVIAFVCTFIDFFNIPFFNWCWPILVIEFIIFFCITMSSRIKHMIRYRYNPFTFGKPKFQAGVTVP